MPFFRFNNIRLLALIMILLPFSITSFTSIDAATSSTFLKPDAVHLHGSLPWVTLLCTDSDWRSVPPEHTKAWFEALMGTGFGGMDNYWQELSYGAINLSGSVVAGVYYITPPAESGVPRTPDKMLNDCAAAADQDIYFPSFYGINLVFESGSVLQGTPAWPVNVEGQTQVYAVIWLVGDDMNFNTLAHEMGHGFGLGHANSHWEMMSYGNGMHTNTFYKDGLGWIPDDRKITIAPGGQASIVVEQRETMPSQNYLLAIVPIGSSTTEVYGVEAIKPVGYDAIYHRNEGVHIFHIDKNLLDDLSAQAMVTIESSHKNGLWLPGDTFVDAPHGVTICIESGLPTGFGVKIGVNVTPTCTFEPNPQVVQVSPSIGNVHAGDVVTFTIGLTNTGALAPNVHLDVGIPNDTQYVLGSAHTSLGTVSGTGPLTYAIGAIPYHSSVELSFAVTAHRGLVNPKVLQSKGTLSWDGGNTSFLVQAIANAKEVFIPLVTQ